MTTHRTSRLGLNAIAAASQILIQTGTGLLIYGYMIRQLGSQKVGGWVAIMAIGMLACISDLGLREALVRRVALANAAGDISSVRNIITTIVISVASFMAITLAFALLPWPWTIAALGQSSGWLNEYGWPIAAIVWMQRVGDCFSAALEGLQRFILLACNNAVASLSGLILAIWLIPKVGVLGAATGMAVQFGTLLLLNYASLYFYIPGGLHGNDSYWDWKLFKASLNYGVSLQSMAISVLITETLSKLMLARVDATALLSYFDFSFRVGRGLRSLLVAGNRVLVPKIAANEASSGDHRQLYRASFLVIAIITLPAFGLAAANAGIIMTLLTGQNEMDAQLVFIMIMFAWLMFCLMDPALNVSMGTGKLKAPIIGHMLMPILMLAGGTLAGSSFGPLGVIAALTLAISFGSLLVIWFYHYYNRIALSSIYPITTLFALVCMALGTWLGLRVSTELQGSVSIYLIAIITSLACMIPTALGSLALFSRLRIMWAIKLRSSMEIKRIKTDRSF